MTGRFVLVVACGLAYFMALAMLTPVIPHYVEDELGLGKVAVGVAVGAFAFGAIALRPFAGRIGDRMGRRVLIVGGALIVATSTAMYGLVDALWWLIAIRVVTGIGEAAFFVGAATMITDLSPPDRRGEAVSYWSVAVYGGLAFGPALGEAVRGDGRYTLAWLVSAGLALVAALLGLATREVARATSDRPSQLINRAAVLPGFVLFLGLIPLAGFSAFMPLYADEQLGIGAGPIFLLYGVLILVVRIVGARIPDRLGGRRSGSIALALASAGIAIVAIWATRRRPGRRHRRVRDRDVAAVSGAVAPRVAVGIRRRPRVGRRNRVVVLRPEPGRRRVHLWRGRGGDRQPRRVRDRRRGLPGRTRGVADGRRRDPAQRIATGRGAGGRSARPDDARIVVAALTRRRGVGNGMGSVPACRRCS